MAGSGAVSDGILKLDNGSSSAFPSVTLLWELVEGQEKGEDFNYERIPRSWETRGGGGLTMGTRHWKAESLAAAPELESWLRQDSRHGAPVTRAEWDPVGGRPPI